MKKLQPPGWKEAKGYSNGVVARGQLVFVAGQVGWNAEEKFETSDFVGQARQALTTIVAPHFLHLILMTFPTTFSSAIVYFAAQD